MRRLSVEIRAVCIVAVLLFCWLALSFAAFPPTAEAINISSPVELRGYAWSNYIGWISMSCEDGGNDTDSDGVPDNVCASNGGFDYGVQINPDETLTGWAWSSNLGWIKFGGLGSAPPDDTDGDSTARITGSFGSYELEGWARACSATAAGDCTGVLDPDAGGWDGWISLNCTNTGTCATANYSIRVGVDRMMAGSFGWGEDVIGWMNFDDVVFTPACTPNGQCVNGDTQIEYTDQFCELDFVDCISPEFCQTGPLECREVIPTGSVEAQPGLVRLDGTTRLEWTTTDAASCRLIQNGVEVYSGGPNETGVPSAPVTNTLDIFLYCENQYGIEYEVDRARVQVVPQIEEI